MLCTVSVRLGSRASIRLINSLGLETASGVKVAGQVQKRRPPLTAASPSRFATSEESDSQSAASSGSSSSSSGTCDPHHKIQMDSHGKTAAQASPCQRCHAAQPPINNSLNANLQLELESIKAEMKKANATINALQDREQILKTRYNLVCYFIYSTLMVIII